MGILKLIQVCVVFVCFGWASGEWCNTDGGNTQEYCTNGCCGSNFNEYCCIGTYIYVVGAIAGIIFISVVVAVICVIACKKKRPGRVVGPPTGQQTINVVSYSNAPPSYGNYGNYGTNYGPPPGQPPMPPAYGSSSHPPPQYDSLSNMPGAQQDPAYPPSTAPAYPPSTAATSLSNATSMGTNRKQ